MSRPVSNNREKQFMRFTKEALVRLLFDEFEKNESLKEENELLKGCLDKLMFDSDVVNVQIHGELGDYAYVRSDKQLKLNVKDD